MFLPSFSELSNFRLEKRFHKLDLDRSGAISVKEFLSVPELRDNPLVQRVADVLDSNRSGEVDFKGKTTVKSVTTLWPIDPYAFSSNMKVDKKSRNGGGELRTFHCHLTRRGPFIFILYISSTRLPLFNSTLSELEGVETFTGEF